MFRHSFKRWRWEIIFSHCTTWRNVCNSWPTLSRSGINVIWFAPLCCHLVMIPVLISTNCLDYEVHEKKWPQRRCSDEYLTATEPLEGSLMCSKVSSIWWLKPAAKRAAAVLGSFISTLKKKKKESNRRVLVPMTSVWVVECGRSTKKTNKRRKRTDSSISITWSAPHAGSFSWRTNIPQKQHLR